MNFIQCASKERNLSVPSLSVTFTSGELFVTSQRGAVISPRLVTTEPDRCLFILRVCIVLIHHYSQLKKTATYFSPPSFLCLTVNTGLNILDNHWALDWSIAWNKKGKIKWGHIEYWAFKYRICRTKLAVQRLETHLIQPLEEAVFVLGAPRLPLPTGPLLVTSLFLLFCWPLSLGHFGHSTRGSSHSPSLAHHPLGGRAILCPCPEEKQSENSYRGGAGVDTCRKNSREIGFGMIKMFCFILWFHWGVSGQKFMCLRLWRMKSAAHTQGGKLKLGIISCKKKVGQARTFKVRI